MAALPGIVTACSTCHPRRVSRKAAKTPRGCACPSSFAPLRLCVRLFFPPPALFAPSPPRARGVSLCYHADQAGRARGGRRGAERRAQAMGEVIRVAELVKE